MKAQGMVKGRNYGCDQKPVRRDEALAGKGVGPSLKEQWEAQKIGWKGAVRHGRSC